MSRAIPIRRSLLFNVLIVVTFLSATIIGLSWVSSRRSVELLSRELAGRALDQTEVSLGRYLDPVDRATTMSRLWAREGLLSPRDASAVRSHLRAIIEASPQISSAMVADRAGYEAMLLRRDSSWRLRLTGPDSDVATFIEWDDTDETTREEADPYDARTRPWFIGAVEAGGRAHWTEPYTFYTTTEPGVTASFLEGDLVVAFDVSLLDVSRFTSGLMVSPGSYVVIVQEMEGEFRVIGLPRGSSSVSTRFDELLAPLDETGPPVLVEAASRFRSASASDVSTIRFRHDHESWWAGARLFPLSSGREFWLGVVIPEHDLQVGLFEIRTWALVVISVVLVIAVFRAAHLATRFSSPIERLVRNSDRIRTLDFDEHDDIDSNVLEIKHLAVAQDRMRDAVQTLLRLEQDLRVARSIQQATFPGSLPKIEGYDFAAWSEPADETGGDTYDVVALRDLGLDDDRIVFFLADATGHGVGPALSVMQGRAMLRIALRQGLVLEETLDLMNRQLVEDLSTGRFVTAWLGILDPTARTLHARSAGQGPILLWRDGDLRSFPADAPPLGVVDDLVFDGDGVVNLEPGDVVLVLSDGIFERFGPDHEQFGVARVEALLREHGAGTTGAEALERALRRAVDAFAAGRPAGDDQTGVVIRVG